MHQVYHLPSVHKDTFGTFESILTKQQFPAQAYFFSIKEVFPILALSFLSNNVTVFTI